MAEQFQKLHFHGCLMMLTVITICVVNSCDAGKTTTGLYLHKEKDWIDRGLDILHGKWDSSEKEVTVFGVTGGVGSSNTYTQKERELFLLGVVTVGFLIILFAFCKCCVLCCHVLCGGKRNSSSYSSYMV